MRVKAMDKIKEDYSLLLLAGGRSSRMGTDKAELSYLGRTFMENLLEKAEQLGIKKKFLSGHDSNLEGVRVVQDYYKDRGPLGGMHACMREMQTDYCLVLPVDVPQIPLEVLQNLLSFHREMMKRGEREIPLLLSHGDRTEPLIGIYPVNMQEEIGEAVQDHPASVFSVLKKKGYRIFQTEIEAWQAENINTPQTYHAVLEHEMGEQKMWREITLEHARELIQQRIKKIQDIEELEVNNAGGYVLAEDIAASLDNPPFPRSPVDGYAVRAEDHEGAAQEKPVSLKVTG